jgi:hypothetical protein
LRFDDGSSDYLTRTPSGNGNRKIFTNSFWIKRANISLGANTNILGSSDSGFGNGWFVQFQTDDSLRVGFQDPNEFKVTSRLFRDPSAWYHIVIAVDVTQGSNSDRVKIYVNGTQETSFSTDNTITNIDKGWNNTQAHSVGRSGAYNAQYFDGYLSDVINIDGTQLTPTSFGETDSNGVWVPKAISGLTFGTNGFHLDFADSADLGNDVSGNDNDFTENNLTSIDATTDTPQNNYATLNPLYRYDNNPTYSQGNLGFSGTGNTWQGANSTFYINTGKWFYEIKIDSGTNSSNYYFGWTTAGDYNTSEPYDNGIHFYNSDGGEIYANSIALTTADYGTFGDGDILGLALDYDNSLLSVYKNGTALFTEYDFSSATTTAKGGNYVTPTIAHYGSGDVLFNFGNPPYSISSGNSDANGYGNFEYAVPSGYFALNTKNLAQYG